jgi:type IV pilus assembly protein PilB
VRPEVLIEMGVDPAQYADAAFCKGAGCERCNNTGYRGRVAIHEIFEMNPELRKMVVRSESNVKIKKLAINQGMRTLRQDGFEKIVLGWTTFEEVMQATQMD